MRLLLNVIGENGMDFHRCHFELQNFPDIRQVLVLRRSQVAARRTNLVDRDDDQIVIIFALKC